MRIKLCFFVLACLGTKSWAQEYGCPASQQFYERLQRLTNLQEHFEEAPFVVACKSPGLLYGRPKSGLLFRSVVEQDADGRKTRDLMKRVLEKAKARVDASSNEITNIENCLPQDTPQCKQAKTWVNDTLPKFVKAARFHLSLAQSQHQARTWEQQALPGVKMSSNPVNANLNSLGSYKLVPWKKLEPDEVHRAEAQLADYDKQDRDEMKRRFKDAPHCAPCETKFLDDAMLAVLFQHYELYHQALGKIMILQYLEGPSVTEDQLKTAMTAMKKDLEKERTHLKKLEDMVNSKQPLNADSLEIMLYSSELEQALLEDSRDCGLATSLLYTISNRQIGNALAIGLPVLAVSFFAPPVAVALGSTAAVGTAVGVGVGIAAGAAMSYGTYEDFQATQVRTFGHIYGDMLQSDLHNLESDKRQFDYAVVTLPAGFGLAGTLTRSVTIGGKALATGIKVFKAANRVADFAAGG